LEWLDRKRTKSWKRSLRDNIAFREFSSDEEGDGGEMSRIAGKISLILLLVSLIDTSQIYSQVRSGVGFLKMMPGARQVGMAGSLTGALDFTDSFYANPGATGLLREWQWSAAYTNWISDIYNASFLYGRTVRTPWSRRTRFVLGLNYLGVPNFDSSDGNSPFVSGNDFLATVSAGQPLGFLGDNFSVGGNLKYLHSELAQFSANALILDFGLLFRSPRFDFIRPGNGFLDYGIVSAGVALTNLGNAVEYLTEATPLPRTFQAGVALNLGAHDGLQISIATDFRRVRDEDCFLSFGTEVSWSQLVTLRSGYSSDNNIVGSHSFGISFRLDDQIINSIIPGRNNALRLDVAANQSNDFFSSPFHGSVTHFPVSPEDFEILEPGFGANINRDTLTLAWESTRDPDLFDDVAYWLVVDRDSLKLAQLVEASDSDANQLFSFLEQNHFEINYSLQATSHTLSDLLPGDYFWAVFAYDSERHIQFAERDGHQISRFRCTAPIVEITEIEFDYSPWITQDDLQGNLRVAVMNHGERSARDLVLAIYDSAAVYFTGSTPDLISPESGKRLLSLTPMEEIQSQTSNEVTVKWRTPQPGLHHIVAEIRPAASNGDHFIARKQKEVYTIPKGSLAAQDTALAFDMTQITYELPFVGKVFFDSSETYVKKKFIREWIIEPPLFALAKRLVEHRELKIALQGTADPNSGENDFELANARAQAVRDTLMNLGVSPEQIQLLNGELLPIRKVSTDPTDARCVRQERRRVEIIADDSTEAVLFQPLQAVFAQKRENPFELTANIAGVVPFTQGSIQFTNVDSASDLDLANNLVAATLMSNIKWLPDLTGDNSQEAWLEKKISYAIEISDSLSRRFKTPPQSTYLDSKVILRERLYFGIAKFALAEPLYNFYWENLLERIPYLLDDENARLRFIGHACAIGPEDVNQRLSKKRAELFQQTFLAEVQKIYPDLYDEIVKRLDKPEAFGESKPFWFLGNDGETVVIGDNETPTGRQMNRRVIALFYSEH
jgi:outer membrane protein OmpA-like peptidoglycan-associated protein